MSNGSAAIISQLEEPMVILIYGRPGMGKSTIANYIVNQIEFDHSMVVTGTPWTYTTYPNVKDNYNIEEVEEFVNRSGVKVLLFDDVAGFDFGKKEAIHLKGVVTRTRHTKVYVILCLHLLNQQNLKVARMTAGLILLGVIDEDSSKYIRSRVSMPIAKIQRITLERYQFLLINRDSEVSKVKISL